MKAEWQRAKLAVALQSDKYDGAEYGVRTIILWHTISWYM